MSQSTPLNQLPRDNMNNSPQNQQQSSSDMVDDILNEMSANDDMNTDNFNHVMDPSQIPPEKMEQNFLNNNSNQGDNMQDVPNNNNLEQNTNNTVEGFNNNNDNNNILSKLKKGNMEELFKNCLKQIKYSIIVFILVMIVSLPQFNRFVFTKVKGMLLESGEINMT